MSSASKTRVESDSLGPIAPDLSSIGVKDVHAVYFHLNLAILCINNLYVRLAEDYKQIALTRVPKIISHVQVGVHPCLKHRDAAKLVELG